MLEKMKKNWDALNVRVIVNKREMVLGMAVCALAGLAVGMLLSPKKQITIGSHNGNNNTGRLDASAVPEEAADEDAVTEE